MIVWVPVPMSTVGLIMLKVPSASAVMIGAALAAADLTPEDADAAAEAGTHGPFARGSQRRFQHLARLDRAQARADGVFFALAEHVVQAERGRVHADRRGQHVGVRLRARRCTGGRPGRGSNPPGVVFV